jgi:hypothetical protein
MEVATALIERRTVTLASDNGDVLVCDIVAISAMEEAGRCSVRARPVKEASSSRDSDVDWVLFEAGALASNAIITYEKTY